MFHQWLNRSEEFFDAASVVWNTEKFETFYEGKVFCTIHPLYRPAMLLMGLCLEVSVKGLLVERDPSVIKNGQFLNFPTTHSLEVLFERAKIAIENDVERKLLKKLSESVIWMSKYPMPMSPQKLLAAEHPNGEIWGRNEGDFDHFERLQKRVLEKFECIKGGLYRGRRY